MNKAAKIDCEVCNKRTSVQIHGKYQEINNLIIIGPPQSTLRKLVYGTKLHMQTPRFKNQKMVTNIYNFFFFQKLLCRLHPPPFSGKQALSFWKLAFFTQHKPNIGSV